MFVVFCACFGCAAAQIALEKKDLKVETQMSDTIFLDIETQIERTVPYCRKIEKTLFLLKYGDGGARLLSHVAKCTIASLITFL